MVIKKYNCDKCKKRLFKSELINNLCNDCYNEIYNKIELENYNKDKFNYMNV